MRYGRVSCGVLLCGAIAIFAADRLAEVSYSTATIAGSNAVGDAGPGTAALLIQPEGIAADTKGNLFIADAGDHRIRKILPDGSIRTLAGNSFPGFRGDGGPAEAAQLRTPYGLCVDRAGNVFIADLGNARVRKIATDGRITTVAGGGAIGGNEADGSLATEVKLLAPRNVAVDAEGNLYISDFDAHRVYKVTSAGILTTVIGTGTAGYGGDGAAAYRARISHPAGLAVTGGGILYLADSGNKCVRKVAQGVITTFVDGLAKNPAGVDLPTGLSVDKEDNLYIADGRATMLKVTSAGTIATLSAGGTDVAVDAAGAVYISGGRMVRKLTRTSLTTVAGTGTAPGNGDASAATSARLASPFSIAQDANGNIYIADPGAARVRKINSLGTIGTWVGGGPLPFSEGAQGTNFRLQGPRSVVVDSKSNLYVADTDGHRIYRVSPIGTVISIAGTGTAGFAGDDGPSALAMLSSPFGLAIDRGDNLYVADAGNNRIRRITPTFFISTIAGGGTDAEADDVSARAAKLVEPTAVAADDAGNLYIAETSSNRIRMVDGAGLVTTIADARTAGLFLPRGMKVAGDGTLFVVDSGNHRIRRISGPADAKTIAGTGVAGYNGDSGAALETQFDTPIDLLLIPDGSILVADSGNQRIRRLTPQTQPVAGEIEQPTTLSVVHGATFREEPVVPGGIVTVYGSGMGPAIGVLGKLTAAGVLETEVGETQVTFDGKAAPIFYVHEKQVNLQAPYEIAGKQQVEIVVTHKGTIRGRATVRVVKCAPGLLTAGGGSGQALVVLENGTLNSTANTAKPGSIVVIYATGDGQIGQDAVSGRPAAVSATTASVRVEIAGKNAPVLYAGRAPGYVGLMQINIRVPELTLPATSLDLKLLVDGESSQAGVNIAVR